MIYQLFVVNSLTFNYQDLAQMKALKEVVLQCDFFAHGSFQRYKQEQSYRTMEGGVSSIAIVILFIGVFANLAISTVQENIIYSQVATQYSDDPTYSELVTSPANSLMFAIGLSGVDLSSNQRYFDIVFVNKTSAWNGTNTVKTTHSIPLQPCTLDQWSGVNQNITNTFSTLNFKQWLCPPTGKVIPLQGKFTSNTFKYGQITVSKCTNNTLYPNTTCKNSTDISTFLTNSGQFTFNFYYINPVINPGNPTYIDYYLQDSNYFSFDTVTGVSANLFYNDYTVTTDTTILPIQINSQVSGVFTSQTASWQNYQIQNNQYFKFYLRKAASQIQYSRSFQKIDQSFSYVGGLFGTIVLLLLPLNIYSKYLYEIDIGEKIFKQNNGGSYGSQNFNFIVFLGYIIFILFSKLGKELNWQTMKKYNQCKNESQKQLGIDLLFKKIAHLQQIAKVLLEQYQMKMLMMVSKPTIRQAKINRKRYLVQNLLYHQLSRKGKQVYVDPKEYEQKLQKFLKDTNSPEKTELNSSVNDDLSLKMIKREMKQSYKKIEEQHRSASLISKKIKNRLTNNENSSSSQLNFIKTENKLPTEAHQLIYMQKMEGSKINKGRSGTDGSISNLPFQFLEQDEELSKIKLSSQQKLKYKGKDKMKILT